MSTGLETFAKVRALHDRTTSLGEKAAAAARLQVLARKAGLTVDQAVSRLDKPPAAPRSLFEGFEELFNTPEARAHRAEREQCQADRRAAALAEYGSEDAVWADTEREIALAQACRPLVVRKPIINGEMDTLMGWTGGRLRDMPPAVREAVSGAYPLPSTVHEAWAELAAWEKLADDRCAFFRDYELSLRARARTAVLEYLLDTLPAHSMRDLRARLDWMQHVLDLGFSRDIHEDQACLDALRADIDRMGERVPGQDPAPVQNGHEDHADGDTPSHSPEPETSEQAVHSGHPRRPTRVERHAAIRALIADGHTDREVARRLGISPTTVGAVRRAAQEAGR